MNPPPPDEFDERQRREAESQIRRMTARLENQRIRAQTGPRVEKWQAEKNRAALKETQGKLPDVAPWRPWLNQATSRQPVSSPAPVLLGRHIPPQWVTLRRYSKSERRQMRWIWAVIALGCAVYAGLIVWRLWP